MTGIRIGMMGFGHIGRQLYKLALADERFDIVAVADIGQPKILSHLLDKTIGQAGMVRLENNYLVSDRFRSRLMPTRQPAGVAWDAFGADIVIDATGKFLSRADLAPHVENGAGRVITSALPEGEVDRMVLRGVNDEQIDAGDRIISAGSASTTAAALALKIIADKFTIEHATMTSIHSYTSDQSLQDYAGADYRRSRSGAENIIPNYTPALHWIQQALPELEGKLSGYALNVPVQSGSMLDLTVALAEPVPSIDAITELFVKAAETYPSLLAVTRDPVVSSDVKGDTHSLLVDLQGAMLAGSQMVKILGWHESLGHASRILEVVASYAALDNSARREVA